MRKVSIYYLWIAKFSSFVLIVTYISSFILDRNGKLHSDLWLPFDLENLWIHLLFVAWRIWITSQLIIIFYGYDLNIFCIITLLSMKFDILCNNIKEALSKSDVKLEDLKNLVVDHNKLFDLSDRIQRLFSRLLLYNFIESSLVICLIGFGLITTKSNATVHLQLNYCLYSSFFNLLLWSKTVPHELTGC